DLRNVSIMTIGRRGRFAFACAVACGATLAVYCPPALILEDKALLGLDYLQLHQHRLEYARDSLFSSKPSLPAWYTRELLGTPFWSNIQSFPFIPTRLVLLAFDPSVAYAIGINLAAVLSALFTFLFCKALGQSPIGAAVSSWTFACAGFFA